MVNQEFFLKAYDNFLNKNETIRLLNFFKTNKNASKKYRDTYTIQLNHRFKDIQKKINFFVNDFEKSIDYAHVVYWQTGSFQNIHTDDAHSHTSLTSITYLNEDFKGGQTYFKDGTIVTPKTNRTIFFDGKKHPHGVKEIINGDRYTLAIWYKNID